MPEDLDEAPRIEEYAPGRFLTVAFVVFTVGLLGLGIYVGTFYDWREIAGENDWLWFMGLLLAFFAGPRILQYVLLRVFDAAPVRWKWFNNVGKSGLNSWWEFRGRSLTKGRFALVYALPALLACLILLAYVIRFPTAAPVIFCLLPLYAINLWYALLALRRPDGTRVEPFERGVRFHQPV